MNNMNHGDHGLLRLSCCRSCPARAGDGRCARLPGRSILSPSAVCPRGLFAAIAPPERTEGFRLQASGSATTPEPVSFSARRRAICEACEHWLAEDDQSPSSHCELGWPRVADRAKRCVPCSWRQLAAGCLADPPKWGPELAERIFVQIASYRDSELVPTVVDLIAHAAYPELLDVCIAWQHGPEESIAPLDRLRTVRIQIIDIPFADSQGSCWARAQTQRQYRGQPYTLQVDSHSRFAPRWDELCIGMFRGLQAGGVQRPVLTTYPPGYDPAAEPAKRGKSPCRIAFKEFARHGLGVKVLPNIIAGFERLAAPDTARFFAGGFVFAGGCFCRDVPYDPAYYFGNDNELSMAIRAYTHGYDLFAPHRNICWHYYGRKDAPKHWRDHPDWPRYSGQAKARLASLLAAADFSPLGLGGDRSLADYEKFSGLDFARRVASPFDPAPHTLLERSPS
jgi:hypothetical protein